MKKDIFFLFLLFVLIGGFTCHQVKAVCAYPYEVVVMSVDGIPVKIYMRGDEYHKYAVSSDGYTLLSDSTGWWYACLSSDGQVGKSAFPLQDVGKESDKLKAFKTTCPKGLKPLRHQYSQDVGYWQRQNTSFVQPVIGEKRALVILMQYRDLPFKNSAQDFESLFNELNYHTDGAIGSVRDYYRYASQGQLDYVSDIYGPYTSRFNMSYYGGNSSNGGYDAHAVDLCVEAVRNLPKGIDFSKYDNDGDGVIDNVHIIFAGYGEEAGASSNAIWSHEYPHRIAMKNEIGYSLAGYSCTPELRGNWGNKISHIGVVCHELGHALGAMDYYDTNYETAGGYEGTGQWDIMASGSWNDDGRSPANFNPYVRTQVFGWNELTVLEPNQQVMMPMMKEDNREQTIICRMNTGSNGDYFLLENRQRYSFDAALPGAGLMIYHVHPNIERFNTTNTVNATHPQGLYPVCASGSYPSMSNYGNINSAGCPFPGTKNVRSFTSNTNPSASAWNGSEALVGITNLSIYPSSGTINLSTSEQAGEQPDDQDDDQFTQMELVYKESFEGNINERMTIISTIGENLWRTYKQGNLIIDPDYIPLATDNHRLFMLYSGKDNSTSESEAVSEYIEINPGCNYILSFDIQAFSLSTPISPTFRLYLEDDYGEHQVYMSDSEIKQWENVEIPLIFAGEKFRYKLYGLINSGGIFIDNFCLLTERSKSSVKDNKLSNCQNVNYSIGGHRLALDNGHMTSSASMGRIFILHDGKKAKKVLQR